MWTKDRCTGTSMVTPNTAHSMCHSAEAGNGSLACSGRTACPQSGPSRVVRSVWGFTDRKCLQMQGPGMAASEFWTELFYFGEKNCNFILVYIQEFKVFVLFWGSLLNYIPVFFVIVNFETEPS